MRTSILLLASLALPSCDGFSSSDGGSGRNHKVQRGETLYSIASREYGDPLHWPLLKEANPWLEPASLQPGDVIYVPPRPRGGPNLFNVDPRGAAFEEHDEPSAENDRETRKAARPRREGGTMGDIASIMHDLVPELSGRTIFGQPVDTLGFLAIGGMLVHAFLQGFLLWIAATITFVRDVNLKKSLKASFQIELVTFFTVAILGAVALVMVHIGTTAPGAPGAQGEPDLLNTIETYLEHPVGLVIGGFLVLGLYLIFCMRFLPRAFGIERVQSLLLVLVAIVLPHLMGLYAIGQRLGVV